MLMAVCHTEQAGWKEVEDLDDLSDLRAEAGNLLWAETDVSTLTDEDVATIAEEFGLHPLAVEDAIHARQRPKVERYENHLFAVFHQLDEQEDQLEAVQIACFVGDRWVLTLHESADRTMAEARTRWSNIPEGQSTPPYLMHTLLDVVVDDYQSIADRLEDEIEQLEEIVLDTPRAPVQSQLYSLKQQLARVRRYALPAQRVLDAVVDAKGGPVSEGTATLFRDVHDHVLRINDQIRNIDELTAAVLDLTRDEQARALNEVTKRLTGWAAIIAVPTLISSIYGMNFDLEPEDGGNFGFWFAIVLIVFAGIALYLFFKRKDWI